MYHAAAKSFVRIRLAVVREHSVLPCGCACAAEFTGAVRRHQTTELRNTGIPPGDLLLPFGQFTLCCACVEQTACVAVKYLALRIGREMGAHCAPLRKKKSSAVPL